VFLLEILNFEKNSKFFCPNKGVFVGNFKF